MAIVLNIHIPLSKRHKCSTKRFSHVLSFPFTNIVDKKRKKNKSFILDTTDIVLNTGTDVAKHMEVSRTSCFLIPQ